MTNKALPLAKDVSLIAQKAYLLGKVDLSKTTIPKEITHAANNGLFSTRYPVQNYTSAQISYIKSELEESGFKVEEDSLFDYSVKTDRRCLKISWSKIDV